MSLDNGATEPQTELSDPAATVEELGAASQSARLYAEELGNRCGFTKSYVSNVEQATANVTLATLEAFTLGLDCHEADLFSRQGERQVIGTDD